MVQELVLCTILQFLIFNYSANLLPACGMQVPFVSPPGVLFGGCLNRLPVSRLKAVSADW
jgi:hypothetical protein